jgi:hypothetical protein
MIRKIYFKLQFKKQDFDWSMYVHRGWSIKRLKEEISYMLNITEGRIHCKNDLGKEFKNYEYLDYYWWNDGRKILIKGKGEPGTYSEPNEFEYDNKNLTCSLWFTDGVRNVKIRMQFEWTMKEAYGVLFINILINNVDANG